MLIGPFVGEAMHFKVFIVAGDEMSIERGDDGFGLRPPEFHVLRIVLRREMTAIAEIDYAAEFIVPAPLPRPIQDFEREVCDMFVTAAIPCLLKQEPRCFNAMTGVYDATVECVNQLAFGADHFKQSLEFGMEEVVLNGIERSVDTLFKNRVGDDFAAVLIRIIVTE